MGISFSTFSAMDKAKEWLSAFVGLLIPIPEGEVHTWGEIIGVLLFLAFILSLLLVKATGRNII